MINIDGVNAGRKYFVNATIPSGEDAIRIQRNLKLLKAGQQSVCRFVTNEGNPVHKQLTLVEFDSQFQDKSLVFTMELS